MNERTLEITVSCHLCGKEFKLKVRPEDYVTYRCSPDRPYIQDIFPYLTSAERELLISNTCQECWDKMFPDED